MSELVHVEIKNGLGIITLNSEKSLNALNQEIVEKVFQTLRDWKQNDQIASVFLQGAGDKAFCAGGDVRSLYHAMIRQKASGSKDPCPESLKFFISEYTLDYEIHTYPKPIMVWAHGIVMGGGIGLMNGASHRIVTEKSKLAMPEITIGLYPDVGATWFFNKLKPGWGVFLAMTAARINGHDCLTLGLADYFIDSAHKDNILKQLTSQQWTHDTHANSTIVTKLLSEISQPSPTQSSVVEELGQEIAIFDQVDSIDEFRNCLNKLPQSPWVLEAKNIFEHGSPSSAGIILEQLKRGKNLSLKEVFQSELNLSVHCSLRPDFAEGVRALLIEKDQKPKWRPATHAEVTREWIESYFTPHWSAAENPLRNL